MICGETSKECCVNMMMILFSGDESKYVDNDGNNYLRNTFIVFHGRLLNCITFPHCNDQ